MGRRIAGIAGIFAGLALIVGTFAVGGFKAASAGERLLDRSRPELTKTGIVALRRNFNNVGAAGQELQTVIVPAYAQAEGLTTQQIIPVLQSRYPAVAAAAAEVPSTLASTDKTIANLERHQSDFEAADDIPTSYLPLSVAPVITLALGLALVVAGGFALRRGSGRAPVVTVLVVGAVVLGFTLGGGMFRKTKSAHDLISSLNITKASAIDTRHRLDVQVAGAREINTAVLPDLQEKLGMTSRDFNAWLRDRAPHLAAIRDDPVGAVSRFEVDVRIREQGFSEFGAIRHAPIQNLPWLYVVSGAVALLGGLFALVWRREPVAATPVAPLTVPAV